MMMRRLVLGVALACTAGLAIGCGVPPGSTPTTTEPAQLAVDQEQLGPIDESTVAQLLCPGAGSAVDSAQTVVAGRTGTLERVSVALFTQYGDPAPLTVTVHTVDAAGDPTDTIIGRGTYDGAALGEWSPNGPFPDGLVDIELDEPAAVVAGTQYLVRFTIESGTCVSGQPTPMWVLGLAQGATDRYTSGSRWWNLRLESGANTWYESSWPEDSLFLDLRFQTWVR